MMAKGVLFIGLVFVPILVNWMALLCSWIPALLVNFIDGADILRLTIDLVVESVFVLARRASCVRCYVSFEYGGGPLPVAFYLLVDIRLFPLV